MRAAVAGWAVAAGVVGAVAGLMAFGAFADAHHEFGIAALTLFSPAAAGALLFHYLPETKDRDLEDWEAD